MKIARKQGKCEANITYGDAIYFILESD